jgi:hypothetical protein
MIRTTKAPYYTKTQRKKNTYLDRRTINSTTGDARNLEPHPVPAFVNRVANYKREVSRKLGHEKWKKEEEMFYTTIKSPQ